MQRIFSCLLITFLAFGLFANEASAKRFGGGRSFGTYRSNSSYSSPTHAKTTAHKKQGSGFKWGGMLGGLLAGGLLASLFMHNGLGGSLLSMLLIAAAILFIISLLRRKTQPAWQAAQNQASFYNPYDAVKQHVNNSGFGANTPTIPAGFIADDFLRDAKVKFIRLQAAYDTKDLADLSEFTTPEVLAEIKLQFQERENECNETNVISLEAELLEVSAASSPATASVRFTGIIKEDRNQPSPLNEIWHFRQLENHANWIVSGVQQP